MGKRKAGEEEEDAGTGLTKEERKKRKRLKKEQKRIKKEERKKRKKGGDNNVAVPTLTTSAAPLTVTSSSTITPATAMVDDDKAVLYRKRVEYTVSLLPAALKNVQMSVEDSLRSILLKHSDGIGGVLLAFENVQIISDNPTSTVGVILNELPHIHYKVAADALVFVPKPGSVLVGAVTETSFHSHVSLVVHHYFNASISAEQLRAAGFAFDEVQLQWFRDDSDQRPLSSNDRIQFVCEKMFESGGIISIEGTKPKLVLQPKREES